MHACTYIYAYVHMYIYEVETHLFEHLVPVVMPRLWHIPHQQRLPPVAGIIFAPMPPQSIPIEFDNVAAGCGHRDMQICGVAVIAAETHGQHKNASDTFCILHKPNTNTKISKTKKKKNSSNFCTAMAYAAASLITPNCRTNVWLNKATTMHISTLTVTILCKSEYFH